jgi:hypothetical protein
MDSAKNLRAGKTKRQTDTQTEIGQVIFKVGYFSITAKRTV